MLILPPSIVRLGEFKLQFFCWIGFSYFIRLHSAEIGACIFALTRSFKKVIDTSTPNNSWMFQVLLTSIWKSDLFKYSVVCSVLINLRCLCFQFSIMSDVTTILYFSLINFYLCVTYKYFLISTRAVNSGTCWKSEK